MFDSEKIPPQFLRMEINNVCNFRCRMCQIWRYEKEKRDVISHGDRKSKIELLLSQKMTITSDLRKKVMLDFKKLNPDGEFNPLGGELFVEKDEIFDVLFYAKEIGLKTSLVSNGSLINDHMAEKIIESGIYSISISLDSHEEEIHDYMRGVDGAYKKAVSALEKLLKSRGNAYLPCINIAVIISKLNINNLEDLILLGKKTGVNSIGFNPLINLFSGTMFVNKDVFYEKYSFSTDSDKKNAVEKLNQLYSKYGNDPILWNFKNDLAWLTNYINDPDYEETTPICGSHEKNIIINKHGNAHLCWNSVYLFKDPYLGNIRETELKELWNSDKARQQRIIMDKCRKNCGANNCNRKQDIAL